MEKKEQKAEKSLDKEALAKALQSLKGAPLTTDTEEWRELVSAPERFGKS